MTWRRTLLPLRSVLWTCVAALAPMTAMADDWPQWRGPARDGVWRETGIVETFAKPELVALWRAPMMAMSMRRLMGRRST